MKQKPVSWPVNAGWPAGSVVLLIAVGVGGCGSERYSRPPGPAPRYEVVPLAPYEEETTGAEPGGGGALDSEIERALASDAGP